MVRVGGSTGAQISTQIHTPQGATPKTVSGPEVAEEVQKNLFGRVAPREANPADYPDLAAMMALLNRCRRKAALMLGDREDEYTIVLAEDSLAVIDANGTIYMGAAFLRAFQKQIEVPVGALMHEMGHRPKRWSDPDFINKPMLTRQDVQELCRHEETRADIFCGKAMAELGYSCEPLIAFLLKTQVKPHPEYHPAHVRAEVIRDAFNGRVYRARQRRKLFRSQHRHTSADGHIGEG